MKPAESKIDPKTLQRLLLARLLVHTKRALSREQVVKSVVRAISPPLTAAEADSAVRSELERCERLGLIANVTAQPAHARKKQRAKPRKREPRPALTAKAQQLAASLFGGQSMPVIRSWEHAQQVVALSVIGRATAADKVLRADDLAAQILGERRGVPAGIKQLTGVVDHLCWRALGVETHAPFDLEAVQRHLLRELVPKDVRVDQSIWRRMLAMRAARAFGHDAEALTRALLAERREPKPAKRTRKAAGSPANDNDPRRRPQPVLADFAASVREAAHMPAVARFHDDRAFIGSVWEQMRARGQLGSMSLAEFKARLIAAHRDGLLRITRADLVSAMDPEEVERSEARYQNATFHFVALEAGGRR